MYLVILLGLAIPLPLAIYLLILTALNRSPHPVLIPGGWDFAMVLFASSGFLIFGGPAVLAGFEAAARDFLLFGPFRHPAAYSWRFWVSMWVVYAVCILAAAFFLLRRRRRATSIYNVESVSLRHALAETLDRLGLEWLRDADQVFIQSAERRSEAKPANELYLKPALVVRVDAFPAMRHVTLHWSDGAESLRQEIEEELERGLTGIWTRGNPVASWTFSIAGSLFALMFFTIVLMVLFVYFLQQATP